MDVPPDGWLTLTEAAARTRYTREAIRQRVRRGSLPAIKGNDGQLRVQTRDLDDMPPPDATTDDPGQMNGATTDATVVVLLATMVDLRTTLDATMDKALFNHGRAERAEAQAAAEATRASMAEAQLAAAVAALAEARTPWVVRVVRAWRQNS